MAEKQSSSQLELFSQNSDGADYRGSRGPEDSFWTRIRGYEKAVLIIMVLALTGIIAYSFGVKNGQTRQGSYTVQVAVFKNKEIALRESMLLNKKGMYTQVFLKDGYIILCVGKFPNSESAQPILAELQKTYTACRIRRI